ncbi:uncharacterized protein LOC111338870 isoform X2 [Stylophora pistillata]|uniref:uncharacterized protein LOC111338870 isoform X2 n=1 Tax=Stylophora pistillata TaxID=50429 RepID=UPI000C03F55F|nr:uncharacterized protein LOC111338870 isoform X2 [Stylophora pistillata]
MDTNTVFISQQCFLVLLCLLCQVQAGEGSFSPKTETSVTRSTNTQTTRTPPLTIKGSSSSKTETSVTTLSNTRTTSRPPSTMKGSFSPKTEKAVTTSTNTRKASRPPSTIEGSSSPRTETSVTTSTNTRTTGRPASTFQECHRPLGMQSGAIEDWQITSRHSRDYRYKPSPGRMLLETARGGGDAWKPYWSYRGVWFQVYLHNKYTWVTGIGTQGSVTTYWLYYWGRGGRWYKEKGQRHAKEFPGNIDRNTVFRNELGTPIRTSLIRIYPRAWRRTIEMRMELYGCKDECLRYKPCKNGGRCVPDYINENYTCICPIEFYGDTCRLGNLCKLSKPCLNGGTCSPMRYWPYFKCICSSIHIGFNCRTRIANACDLEPCLNSGTCRPVKSWPFIRCSCRSGYAGFNCGIRIVDRCSHNPCPRNWTCKTKDNGIGFDCDCSSGDCSYKPACVCQSHPCLHGGTCLPDNNVSGDFKCVCPAGYVGYNCEYAKHDSCSAESCRNGGTCKPDSNPLGFECNCHSGYIGFNCGIKEVDPCSDPDNNPCENGGTCVQQNNALGYTCKCTSEYIGFDCGFLKDDPCSPNPCQNEGNCTRNSGQEDFICNCAFGYTGKKCQNLIVHGNWSLWTPWPNCNKPCNNGTRTRRRVCDNPSPAFGGKSCEGLSSETEPCNKEECPAEKIKYEVKLKDEKWKDYLAVPKSKEYVELENRIKKAVKDFYHKTDENVEELKFWKGSVISSFDVIYESIDSLQIVSFLEEIEGGTLGDIPVELRNIKTRNVPQQAPEIVEANSTKSTSIDIKWMQRSSAPFLGNMIVYKETGKKFKTNTIKSVPATEPGAVLEDLKKFTNYTIRVFTFTNEGNGVPSDDVTVRTQEDVPSQPPPDSVVTSTSSSIIHVSWGPISPDFVHGRLVGYEVRYAKDDESSEWENKRVDFNVHETVLSDLEYFTRYKVVICARTSKGCGKNVSHTATTFGDAPSKPPQNVAAEKLKAAESIKVSWNEVPFGHVNGLLMGYSIKYRRVKTAEKNLVYSVEETAIAKSNDLWIILSVQTYSVYEIRVAAFTQKGLGPYSEYKLGETCRCPKTLYTNYWSTPPYLKVNQEDNTLDGIFSHIVTDMIYTACGECPAYGSTEIDITSNGNKQPSAKESLVDVLGDIDDVPQISFPIYGNKYVTRFGGVHAYVNLVQSPGLAFVAAKSIPGAAATNMINAVFSCFPLVILSACMSFISGFIIWLLDTTNRDEFPTSFRKGVGEGFWWSFISMTTVGYGDRSPRSVPARMFGITWTLTGLVIISILVGAIASALTSVTVKYPVILYGSKIGVIQNSTEHRIGTLKNARVNEEENYKNLKQLRTALENGEIEGALIDTYVAAEHKDELFSDKIYVKQILDRPFGYGVVLSGAAVNVEQRCRDYINQHMSYISHMIPNSTKTLDPAPPDESVELSTDLFDGSSEMFLIALASLCGMLGFAVLGGITYHYLIFVPHQRRADKLKASSSQLAHKKALVAEMRDSVRIFHSQMSTRITAEMGKCRQALKEIREDRNNSKQGGSFFLKNIVTNPIYSDSSQGFYSVVGQRPLASKSAESIVEHGKHSPYANTAALNSSGETLSLGGDRDKCHALNLRSEVALH